MADKRTVNIHGKEYELVASRVERFREEHPNWAISTYLVDRTDVEVVVKAIIKDESDRIVATGYAEEQREASVINRTSAVEVCETSAIGRALACLGYIGGEYASADEVANAVSQQKPKGASAAQKKMLVNAFSDANGAKATEEDVANWAGTFGIDWNQLSHQDVQTLLQEIRQVKEDETNPREPEE